MFNLKTLGGILILAGTSIGAGMLALPITSAPGGFFYSILLLFFACCYMSYTVFILLEVNLINHEKKPNMMSMVRDHLGPISQGIAWGTCLLLLYAVAAAYMTAGGAMAFSALHSLGVSLPSESAGAICFLVFFGGISLLRTQWIDYFNRLLMISLIVSFIALVVGTQYHALPYHYEHGHPKYLLAAVPVVFLSFTCQPVFPSVCAYFDYDVKTLKRVILYGCLVPLLFYTVWETIILGILPQQGDNGLIALAQASYPVSAMIIALEEKLGIHWLGQVIASFSFFALATSFLAVALGLADFLEDGLKLQKNKNKRWFIPLLTFFPPIAFASLYPSGFIFALSYSGVFVAILYGIFPAMMAWRARYCQKIISPYQAPFGRMGLILAIIIGILVILFQICATLNWLPMP